MTEYTKFKRDFIVKAIAVPLAAAIIITVGYVVVSSKLNTILPNQAATQISTEQE